MIVQDVPPDIWERVLGSGGSMGAVAVAAYVAVKGAFNGLKGDVKDCRKALFGDPTAVPPTPGLVALVTKLYDMSEENTEEQKIEAEVQRRVKARTEGK